MLVVVGLPFVSIWQMYQVHGDQVGFGAIFLNTWIILMFFNLFDLLILDWLMMVRIQPKSFLLPGTEGMDFYNDYGHHFKGFLKGIVITLVISLVFAGASVLVTAVLT